MIRSTSGRAAISFSTASPAVIFTALMIQKLWWSARSLREQGADAGLAPVRDLPELVDHELPAGRAVLDAGSPAQIGLVAQDRPERRLTVAGDLFE